MKKYRWNKKKFVQNMLITLVLIAFGLLMGAAMLGWAIGY